MEQINKVQTDKKKSSGRKKLPLSIAGRAAIGIGAVVLLAAGGVLLYSTLQPAYAEHTVEDFACTMELDGTYQVFLKENTLYAEPSLPQGQVYSELLTDHIALTLTAGCQGSQAMDFQGYYQVTAQLTGYITSETQEKTVYEKTFPLGSGEMKQVGEQDAQAEVPVWVDLGPYRLFAQQAAASLGSTVQKRLEIVMETTFRADAQAGSVEKDLSYRLPLTLGDGKALYTISLPSPVQETQSITHQETELLSPSVVRVVLSAALFLLGSGGILFAALFVRPPTPLEQWRKTMRGILRKHSSILVQLEFLPAWPEAVCNTASSIQSLALLAEELRLPIFCACGADGLPAQGYFCLEYQGTVYQYCSPPPEADTTFVPEAGTASGI